MQDRLSKGLTDGRTNPPIAMMMVVTVMLLRSDESEGPRIGQALIIYAFSIIEKKRETNQRTNQQTNQQSGLLSYVHAT